MDAPVYLFLLVLFLPGVIAFLTNKIKRARREREQARAIRAWKHAIEWDLHPENWGANIDTGEPERLEVWEKAAEKLFEKEV